MLKMVDGTGIIGVDMVCPLGGAVSPPQPPNFDKVEVEGVGSLMLPNSLKAPLERLELIGNSVQGENPAPDNPQEIKSAGKHDEVSGKYLFDVKVAGKNLFNVEKAKDANNWTSSAILPSYKEFSIYVGKGNSVNISYLENLETGLGFYANIAHSKNDYTMYWLYHSDSEINITKNKNFIAMNDYIILRVDSGSVPKFFEYIKTLQIEIGSKQTPYEPYTEQSVQIALNEPLRGIGEYKDTITKDGVARKIKKAVFDGSEGWSIDKIVEGNTTQTFVLILKDVLSIPNHDKRIMCDKFKFGTALWTKDIVAIGTYSNKLYLNVEKDKTPDLQTFKTWLSQNPLTVDYVLAEPVTEPLPGSVQAQLQALHSENGVTHVFVDSGEVPCGIKLTYRKEK